MGPASGPRPCRKAEGGYLSEIAGVKETSLKRESQHEMGVKTDFGVNAPVG